MLSPPNIYLFGPFSISRVKRYLLRSIIHLMSSATRSTPVVRCSSKCLFLVIGLVLPCLLSTLRFCSSTHLVQLLICDGQVSKGFGEMKGHPTDGMAVVFLFAATDEGHYP